MVVVEGSSSSSISLLVRLVKAVYGILLKDISHSLFSFPLEMRKIVIHDQVTYYYISLSGAFSPS